MCPFDMSHPSFLFIFVFPSFVALNNTSDPFYIFRVLRWINPFIQRGSLYWFFILQNLIVLAYSKHEVGTYAHCSEVSVGF